VIKSQFLFSIQIREPFPILPTHDVAQDREFFIIDRDTLTGHGPLLQNSERNGRSLYFLPAPKVPQNTSRTGTIRVIANAALGDDFLF
jgi:hypothetical protein